MTYGVQRVKHTTATRVPLAGSQALFERLGLSYDETVTKVGVKKRGAHKGEIDGSVWIIDVGEGGWTESYTRPIGYREELKYGRRGVVYPGRYYVITKGWCDEVVVAHDGKAVVPNCSWDAPWFAPAAREMHKHCRYGFLGHK